MPCDEDPVHGSTGQLGPQPAPRARCALKCPPSEGLAVPLRRPAGSGWGGCWGEDSSPGAATRCTAESRTGGASPRHSARPSSQETGGSSLNSHAPQEGIPELPHPHCPGHAGPRQSRMQYPANPRALLLGTFMAESRSYGQGDSFVSQLQIWIILNFKSSQTAVVSVYRPPSLHHIPRADGAVALLTRWVLLSRSQGCLH